MCISTFADKIFWAEETVSCKIYNAHFFDAYIVRGIMEKCVAIGRD